MEKEDNPLKELEIQYKSTKPVVEYNDNLKTNIKRGRKMVSFDIERESME